MSAVLSFAWTQSRGGHRCCDRRRLLMVPLYHDMGLAFVLSAALAGAPLVGPDDGVHGVAVPLVELAHSDSGVLPTAAPNFATTSSYARRVSEVDLGAL